MAGRGGTDASVRARTPAPAAWPWLLAAALAVVYTVLSLARLHRVATSSWDLAIFEQVIGGYARLEGPVVDVQGPGASFFGDHFSPALALLAPIYRVLPYTETLLVLQALLVAGSVLVVTRVAARHLGMSTGLAVGAAYGLSWGVQSYVDFDFHELALAAPLLALAGGAYVARDWTRVLLWSAPLVLVKEDLALTVIGVGVVLAVSGAPRRGAGLAVGAALAFALLTVVVIPAANPEGVYRFWPEGGEGSLLDALLGLPLALVSPSVKVVTLVLSVVVTAGLALRSPWAFVAVPGLAIRLVSDNPNHWGTDYHYSLLVMTVVFVALVDARVRVQATEGSRWSGLALHAPAAALAVAVALCAVFPFRDLIEPATYRAGERGEHAEQVLSAVPTGVSVASDIGLLSQLVEGRTTYWVGSDLDGRRPDYVVLDDATWSGSPRQGESYAEQLVPGADYVQVLTLGTFQVMRLRP